MYVILVSLSVPQERAPCADSSSFAVKNGRASVRSVVQKAPTEIGAICREGTVSEIPDSMEIIAGIADVKSKPQPVDELRARIDALLEVVPEQRLLVSSSCGCGRVPHDEAIRLMRNLVKAAA